MLLKFLAKFTGWKKHKTQVNLTFSVKNMSELDEALLEQALKTEGFLLFSGDEIKLKIENIMKDTSIGINEYNKSPSQKLRGAISYYWEHKYEGEMSFEDFYVGWMNKIINLVKSK